MIRDAIARLVDGSSLSADEMAASMEEIFGGEATPAQIAALLVALRMQGETAAEVAAAARVMRRHAVPVPVATRAEVPLLDTCGTGGSGTDVFNVSTIAAIALAACGVRVAKHGNRAASSRCGSADLLEALGVRLELPPDRIGRSIDEIGIGFMFARAHHPAMRHAAPVRAELGVRTIFNFLGPLTNPAGATHQLLGVSDGARLELLAQALLDLGVQAAWVVHGAGGLDELALHGPSRVIEVSPDGLRERTLSAEAFGLAGAPLSELRGGDAAQNAAIARAVLAGQRGPKTDAVVLNAAAGLCVVGAEREPRVAAERVRAALTDGSAAQKLDAFRDFTRA